MKMANIQEVYENINNLLGDICRFLSDDKLKSLSPSDRAIADKLIRRSKTELEQIAKITISKNKETADTEYVDMQINQVTINNIQHERQNMMYHTSLNKPEIPQKTPEIKQSKIEVELRISPYKDLPAKDASKDVKSGQISMKRKVILNFETMRRVYASIHNNWLLIYLKEKDMKPKFEFDLKEHRAQGTNPENLMSLMFELTNSSSEKYYFTAQTHKDMLQWVSHINSCHNRSVTLHTNHLSDDSQNELDEHYDSITSPNNNEDDEENIYVEIIRDNKSLDIPYNPRIEEKPLLPRRPSLPQKISLDIPKFVPRPVIESPRNSDDSGTTYDAVGWDDQNEMNSPISPTSSFSGEDDSDNIYDSFLQRKETLEKLLKGIGGPPSPRHNNLDFPPPPRNNNVDLSPPLRNNNFDLPPPPRSSCFDLPPPPDYLPDDEK